MIAAHAVRAVARAFWGSLPGVAILLVALVATGCGNSPDRTAPVQLSGVVTVGEGGLPAPGKVHVNVYQAWSLTGELRHPLQFITGFESDGGEFTHAFDYPLDKGEGLAVYAWHDDNGDGVFCRPDARTEASGLTVLENFRPGPGPGPVTVRVALTTNCAGQDWFFPGTPPALPVAADLRNVQ